MKRGPWQTAGLLGAGMILLVLSLGTWRRAGLCLQNPLLRADRPAFRHAPRHAASPAHRCTIGHGRRHLEMVPQAPPLSAVA